MFVFINLHWFFYFFKMKTKQFFDTHKQREFLFEHKVFSSVENMKQLEWCANWLDNTIENFVTTGERIAKKLPFWKQKKFINKLYDIQQDTESYWKNEINEMGKQFVPVATKPEYKKPIIVEGFKL